MRNFYTKIIARNGILPYLCGVIFTQCFMEELEYHYKYPHPSVTTDCVIFGFDGTQLNVLLIERGIEPYKGCWALPGGFVRMNESADVCAKRELWEETGIKTASLRQFHTFSAPDRDPRERVITIAYYALVRLSEVRGGDDAAKAQWFPIDQVPRLAFDHDLILHYAKKALQRDIYFEPVGFELLQETFTMTQLQHLYEAILGVKFDRRNFYKKMLREKLLTEHDAAEEPTSRRNAILYSFNPEGYDLFKKKGFKTEF